MDMMFTCEDGRCCDIPARATGFVSNLPLTEMKPDEGVRANISSIVFFQYSHTEGFVKLFFNLEFSEGGFRVCRKNSRMTGNKVLEEFLDLTL